MFIPQQQEMKQKCVGGNAWCPSGPVTAVVVIPQCEVLLFRSSGCGVGHCIEYTVKVNGKLLFML